MNIMIAIKDACIINVKTRTTKPSIGRSKHASTRMFGTPIDTRV